MRKNHKISKLVVPSTKQDYKTLKHAVRPCGHPLFPTDHDLKARVPAVNIQFIRTLEEKSEASSNVALGEN